MKLFQSLRARIVFYITILLILTSVVTAVITWGREQKNQLHFIHSRLRTMGMILSEILSRQGVDPNSLGQMVEAIRRDPHVRWAMVLNPHFQCLYSTDTRKHNQDFASLYLPFVESGQTTKYQPPDGNNFLPGSQEFLFPLEREGFPLGYLVIHVFIPQFSVENQVNQWPIILTGLLTVFIGGLLSIIISQFIMSPIEKLTQATRRVSQGHFDTAVELEGDDKLKKLAYHFNSMSHQIKQYLGQLKEKNILLERNYQEIRALYHIAARTTHSLDTGEIATAFLTTLLENFLADAVYLELPGDGSEGGRDYFFSREDGQVATAQRKILLAGLRSRANTPTPHYEKIDDSHWLFLIPLKSINERLANLVLLRRGAPFTEEDQRFLDTISPQFTQTLLNLKLHQATRGMEAYITNLINSLREGVISVNPAHDIITANGAFFQIFEMAPVTEFPIMLDRLLGGIRDEKGRDRIRKLVQELSIPYQKIEFRLEGDPLRPRIITCEYFPLVDHDRHRGGKVFLFEDITEKRRVEAEMSQNEKLVSIGRMAANINHEIGNALTPIKTLTGVIKTKIQDPEVGRYLDVILRELARLEKILRGLKQFSKKIVIEPARVNLDQFLDRLRLLLEKDLKEKNIALRLNYPPKLQWIFDHEKILQTIVNIFQNSIEAVRDAETPNPEISLTVTYQKKVETLFFHLADNGPGIPATHQQEIFEAFFTTKQHGTGLGLALCRQIAQLHGGKLYCLQNQPAGAHFMLELPKRFHLSDSRVLAPEEGQTPRIRHD